MVSSLGRHSVGGRARGRGRNTNIEALRLVAMGFIAINHMQWREVQYIDPSWSYIHRMAISQVVSFFSNWGGVGDCLFFSISAWFLCGEQQSLKRNVGRCWQLQKQLWFWSIVTGGAFVVVRGLQGLLTWELALYWGGRSLLPFSTNLWWYPTSYILFLLSAPLLTQGLRRLNKVQHGTLCMALIIMYAFLPSRFFPMDLTYSIVLFVYLYIIVTFLRWHLTDLCVNRRFAKKMLAIGLFFGLSSQFIVQCFSPDDGYLYYFWMNTPRCLPSICIALAFLIFATTARERFSKIVNYLAASTLSVYLVVTSQMGEMVLRMFARMASPGLWGIVFILVVALVVYAGILVVDMVRHWVFSKTFNLNEVNQLEWIWLHMHNVRDKVSLKMHQYISRLY